MEPLSEELVDETYEEFAGFDPDEAYKKSFEVSKSQPEILAFVVEMTEELEQEVKELAIYMFFVIHQIFQNGYGKKIEKITSDEIIACYEDNETLLENIEDVHDKFLERIAKVQMASQPYVVRYVVEALFEADQGDDPISLEEKDLGYIFLIMKTVIDVLNKKTDS